MVGVHQKSEWRKVHDLVTGQPTDSKPNKKGRESAVFIGSRKRPREL